MSLTNSQYDQIMRNYNRKQLNHEHQKTARRETLYTAIPKIKEIDDAIATTSSSFAIHKLTGTLPANSSLAQELHKLTKEKHALLAEHGYPADYLVITYDCPDCKDTGYCDGHKCHCFKQAELDLIYEQSHLKESVSGATFDDFQLDYYSKTLLDSVTNMSAYDLASSALSKAKVFVNSFECNRGDNLLIYGPVGVGKTFLTNCISSALLAQNYSVIYFTAFSLFEVFQAKVFDHSSKAKEESKNIYDCDLLIIDDLGTEVGNSFTSAQLFTCINERLLRHKSTIISSNLMIPQILDKYSERTFSRITGNYNLLKLNGTDLRIQRSIL